MPVSTHKRAAAGGERGANGEWYEGGKFINTVPENGKGVAKAHRPKPLRKAEIEPYKWVMQPFPGAFTVLSQIGGIEIYNRRENTFSFNPGLCGGLADPAYILVRQNRIARYNAGERWLPQPHRGVAAGVDDAERAGITVRPADGPPLDLSPYGRFPTENFHASLRYVKAPYPRISEGDCAALAAVAAGCDVLTDPTGTLYAFGQTEHGTALLPIDPVLRHGIVALHAVQNQDADALFPTAEPPSAETPSPIL